MTDRLLGIDLGTSAVKALLMDCDGHILGSATADYPIVHPAPGFAEQDPTAWWDAVVRAVRAATHGMAVSAIGLSGQMHGLVALDRAGRVLMPAIIWPDQRSIAQVDEITARVGRERLIEITGSPLATGFLAASVAWLQRNQPALWADVAQLLLPKDYLRLRLTGVAATDPSDGSGALLLDVHRRDWSDELLARLALDRALLPPVQPSSAVAGVLLPKAAGELGLSPGIPVSVGAADTACSALGAGAVDAGSLLLTISTGGQLVQPVNTPAVDRAGRIHTFCSAFTPEQGPGWYQMGAILSAGNALRWLRDNVFDWRGDDAYARMTALAATVPAGAHGLLFLPYLAGERTPHMDPTARGLFSGLALHHGQAELVRAVMEGVTLAAYDAFQVLVELGAQPAQVILAGGGARSALWRQMVADLFGAPVQPLAVAEQSAVGAVLLAGAATNRFALAATARAWACYDPPVEPDPAAHALYAERFAHFQALYAHNRGHF